MTQDENIELLLAAYTLQELNPREYQYIEECLDKKEPIGQIEFSSFDAPTMPSQQYREQQKRIVKAIKFRKEFETERVRRARLIRSTKKTSNY